MKRILVIRGGAIGDFILTLPALALLRRKFPDAHIEILGYKHIAALAENRFYAQAVRSIEYGPLSSFFARDSDLDPELVEYFASFDLIVSYLFDLDEIFEGNLRRCGVKRLLTGSPKINDHEHAAQQLARPLEQLGLSLKDRAARLYLSNVDRDFAQAFWRGVSAPLVALHPGSGGQTKNWPLENWIELGEYLLSSGTFVVIAGEADEVRSARLESIWKNKPVRFAKNLPLPQLAAVLQNALFIGHDSGISHLAAAAGARCILLFGPTNPAIWAPQNKAVRIVRAPNGNLHNLRFETVRAAMRKVA